MRALFTSVAAFALAMPALPAQSRSINLSSCGSLPPVKLVIPSKPPKPGGDHDCCKQGCHAAPDRKKKDGKHGCC